MIYKNLEARKKDFVPPNTKSICNNRTLTSGKAYFLFDKDTGKFFGYAGKECVSQYTNTDLSTIPDLTKSLLVNFEKNIKTVGNKTNHQSVNKNKDRADAITYLLLRQEVMSEFNGIKYDVLENYYKTYMKSLELLDDAVRHILNIEKKLPKFRLNHLLTCYAYEYKIGVAMEYVAEEKKEFLKSIQSHLRNHYTLSKEQINGLKKWFQFIKCKEIREAKLQRFYYPE
ncbi:hypothetical protein BBW65_02445 [Helicobacter enhydrae]|uniref:Uncharacterized protein n=1 Tax=Helicobacter enhydrae TaxID=222136 RepID=A0A1B1U4N7_9HELI|nr:hypothetical protein [Helicobacter enhydrae]ANV97733.1 hypothetical protein BBW65_02445 [Helicobacter enhydrae]